MRAKVLANGSVAYFWAPPTIAIKSGFTIKSEALGRDYGAARGRAEQLNQDLSAWRRGKSSAKDLDLQPGFGSLAWLVERYKRTRAWEKVSKRSAYEYERALRIVLRHKLKTGAELGSVQLSAVTPKGVDKLYASLQQGRQGARRLRQANVCIARMARAWDAVRRHYPKLVPAENPFRGVDLEHGKGSTRAASREEAYALHAALVAAGEPHLAVVPLVAFEWHQRPENILAGHITWSDYRPSANPNVVRVFHHKTGVELPLQLYSYEGEAFFPELTSYLDGLERLGIPIVLMKPRRQRKGSLGPAKPFLLRTARARVRQAAAAAGLPADLTLAACRHGGLTELGNAEVTEAGVIALSGHRTAEAARGYVKRTAAQREAALLKRRAWVHAEKMEHHVHTSRNASSAAESE